MIQRPHGSLPADQAHDAIPVVDQEVRLFGVLQDGFGEGIEGAGCRQGHDAGLHDVLDVFYVTKIGMEGRGNVVPAAGELESVNALGAQYLADSVT